MNSLKVFYPNYSPVFLRIKNNHKKTSHNRLVLKGFWSARENLNLRPRHPMMASYDLKGCYVPETEIFIFLTLEIIMLTSRDYKLSIDSIVHIL